MNDMLERMQSLKRMTKEFIVQEGVIVPSILIFGTQKNMALAIDNMPATHDKRLALFYEAGKQSIEFEIGALEYLIIIQDAIMTRHNMRQNVVLVMGQSVLSEKIYAEGFMYTQDDLGTVTITDDLDGDGDVQTDLFDAFLSGFAGPSVVNN